MRQLMLGFVKQQRKAVTLQPDVEKAVVAWMAQMIADLIQNEERRNDDHPTHQQ